VAAGAGPPCPACASPSLPFLLSLLPTSPSPTLFFPPSSPSLSSRPSCRVESFLTWCGPYRPMRRLSPPARRLTRADLPLPPSNRRSSSSEVRLCLLRKLSCPSRLGYPTSWLARQDAPVPGRTLVRLLTMLPAPLTSASSFAPSAEGTDTSQGTPQLLSNISSCLAVANVVATTLGPRGMDKLIVDANVRSLTLFLTSRAAGFITRAGAAERVDETGRRALAAGGVPGLPGARLNRGTTLRSCGHLHRRRKGGRGSCRALVEGQRRWRATRYRRATSSSEHTRRRHPLLTGWPFDCGRSGCATLSIAE
jgi:hypothetical protein